MCNLYTVDVGYRAILEAFSNLKLPLLSPGPQRAPNLPPLDVRPTDRAPVIRPMGEGVELAQMRWGLLPGRPKAPPVINFRSEGRRFTRGRCLVPASGFYEFTGDRYPKTRWRFTRAGQDWFCLAGLWRSHDAGEGPQARFTLLTTAPGPDVAPYHDRQVVVIDREDWPLWLGGEAAPERLLQPLPAGALTVGQDPQTAASTDLFS